MKRRLWHITTLALSLTTLSSFLNNQELSNGLGFHKSTHVIPFELIENMVVVRATLDGTKGLLCIDLNRKGLYLVNSQSKEVNASAKFSQSSKDQSLRHWPYDVYLGTWVARFEKVGAVQEEEMVTLGFPIIGIAGREIFAGAEIEVDYTTMHISVFSLNQQGKRKAHILRDKVYKRILPIDWDMLSDLTITLSQSETPFQYFLYEYSGMIWKDLASPRSNEDRKGHDPQPEILYPCIVMINFKKNQISIWEESNPFHEKEYLTPIK